MASRICVGNLPPRLYDENAIRKLFKEFGEITDVSLPGKNLGKKTGLAFVGFAAKNSASSAIAKRNGTFAGTVKISVSFLIYERFCGGIYMSRFSFQVFLIYEELT